MSNGLINKIKYMIKCVSDKPYLQAYYFLKFKRFINFKNPETFNEKLQWLKLYDRNPKYTIMVDKYEAKKYVSEQIGEEHIIPTFGVWDRYQDIDFNKLPDQFVLKCTHDSAGLVICRDKNAFDVDLAREKINRSLNTDYFFIGREWPYKNVKPRIIAEKYMVDDKSTELTDYKFYCINGKPEFLYVSQGMENHETARVSFLTMDWQFAPFGRNDYKGFDTLPNKPDKFEEMKELAKKLSHDISFLRVDLYEINGQVYFGELTFYPCGGMMVFDPPEWDKKIGDILELP